MGNIGIFEISLMLVGTVYLALWMFLWFKGKKYEQMFDALDKKDFPVKELYALGYAALELAGYKYKSKSDRKLRQELTIIYGEKYTEYYLRVTRSQQVSTAMTMLTFAVPFYCLSSEPIMLVLIVVMALTIGYSYGTKPGKKIEERTGEIMREFSDVSSKLALLTNAGMILREAWEQTAYGSEGVIYTEMQKSVSEMNNGIDEMTAIIEFGRRCMSPEIKKFTSTLVQGIAKGNRELASMIQAQNSEIWLLRKQLVMREGEKAASKLLIPICVMFIGVLIIVIVPIFTNLGI